MATRTYTGEDYYNPGIPYPSRATEETWLRFDAEDDEEPSHEANVTRDDDGRYVVGWSHTAVGQVTERRFDTLAEAHAWLEGAGYTDFTA